MGGGDQLLLPNHHGKWLCVGGSVTFLVVRPRRLRTTVNNLYGRNVAGLAVHAIRGR